ncbi:MAG: hypothetical protein BZY75_06335 [SAR202 cluster bacterium Io17-Chloro-G7]|nr:MAG: hypothetical protein BZY75_06335 [SAR202 cluster bacterium Io17-Chloro-G7]
MWGAGNISQPPPPVVPVVDPAIERREREIADQQRKLDDQERKMAEQERRLSDVEREKRLQEEKAKLALEKEPPSRRKKVAEEDEASPIQARTISRRVQIEPEEDQDEDKDEEWDEDEADTIITLPTSSRKRPSTSDDQDDDLDPDDDEDDEMPISEYDELEVDDDEEEEEKPRRKKLTGTKVRKRTREASFRDEPPEYDDDQEPKSRLTQKNGNSRSTNGNGNGNGHANGSRVYQEYMELLGETAELGGGSEPSNRNLALDVNLISSLTRWAVIAKQRVDNHRLSQILELYGQFGHLTPELMALLTQIIVLVDGDPVEPVPVSNLLEGATWADGAGSKTNAEAQNCIDLIFHLHGVLAGSPAFRSAPTPKATIPIT